MCKASIQALLELENVAEEAKEEGFIVPNEIAFENAKRLIKNLLVENPCEVIVYPMPDGEIAIDVPNGKGSSLMVLCDSDGGALCSVNINGNSRQADYPSTTSLPDKFIAEALEDLSR